ncbi:MAG: nickel pincer cofactor biosynthesis protein LarB [candidate division NC10 bacterium]|nr:nickel pincer cofactor biosynthesis protein LarB [candidate division NC10 bacterium]
MDLETVRQLLEAVRAGTTGIEEALTRLKSLPFDPLPYATVDTHRALRQGFPEVIFCEGKSPEQVAGIAERLLAGSSRLLATRATPAVYERIRTLAADAVFHEEARAITVRRGDDDGLRAGRVLILTAGTADIPVAEEAAVTADLYGSHVETVHDVGVAGLHRLLAQTERLRGARVLVAVAGMDGVLPSVVGGLTDRPLIAVPTSVGYGASLAGLAALLTMLNSCAAGVAVVNIDNGFGAGVLAHRINTLGA